MNYEAIALVEVFGEANGILMVDCMLKAAEVRFETEYYWNGGQYTGIFSGSVSALSAAMEHTKNTLPCRIFASAVIPAPSEETGRVLDNWKAGNKI